jgi:CheY-like chemotaxis protein
MDCHMPEMDGFEAAAAIRSQGSRGSRIPIIAVSASVLEEDRERCLRSGMGSHLAKPLRKEALFQAILAALPEPVGAPPECRSGPIESGASSEAVEVGPQ